jgi:large subunit ribosomal protein L4
MKLDVYKIDGSKTSEKVELNPEVFEITPNESVVHIAIKNYLANQRQGTHSTKTRTQKRGGGRKPYRQKGTGRARQGSTRSPVLVGGGRAHGPHPRDYSSKLPKKVTRLARCSVLSDKAGQDQIRVVEDFSFEEPKTGRFVEICKNLELSSSKVLFVTKELDRNLVLSARNVPYAQVYTAPDFSVYDVLNSQYLVFQKGAVQIVNEVLAS